MPDRLKRLVVTGLGLGYLPIAPGSWGSLGPCAIYLVVATVLPTSGLATNFAMAVVAVLSCIGCVTTGRFAQTAFGKKDPGQCVIDEWAGQAVTLLLLPCGPAPYGPLVTAGVAFLAFRLFDIVKVPPARQFEKLPYGWGVLLDDIAAGVYANIVCPFVLRLALNY